MGTRSLCKAQMDSISLGQRLVYRADAATAASDTEDGMRTHLGASVIGDKCERRVWYGFRWVDREEIPGRMLRLFERGHSAEETIGLVLKQMGGHVVLVDDKGEQYRISDLGGHYGGGTDGFVMNLPDLPVPPGEWVLLEMKTHNDKSFKDLQKKGVYASKPKHFKQAQVYMGYFGVKHCLYCAVNKNDDALYFEFFPHDPAQSAMMKARAERVVFVPRLPPRLSNNPGWFECTFCPMRGQCFGIKMPKVNCRTCVHSRALPSGGWQCLLNKPNITENPKADNCVHHVFHPETLGEMANIVSYAADATWIQYRKPNGEIVINGTGGVSSGNLDLTC